jgi:uncharacterized protein (TIGR02145 family)
MCHKVVTAVVFVFFTANIFFTQAAYAQAPQSMTYQSVIRNSSNALIANTLVGMKISVLQGSDSGAAVFVETQEVTTNINGLVSLQIGNGNAVTGTFSGIDWAAGPYFIKTDIDPTGGSNYTITGIQQMGSVPYALYAAKSGDITSMGTIGGSSTANGGTITSGVLSLTPADRDNGGIVTNGMQDFDGNKSFYGDMTIYNYGNSGSKVKIYNNNNTFTNPIGTNLNIEGYLSYAGIPAGNYPLYSTADINPGTPDYVANSAVTFDNLTALHLTSPDNYFDNFTSNWWALLTDGDVKVNGKVITSGTYTGAGFKTPNGQANEFLMADGSVNEALLGIITTMQAQITALQNQVASLTWPTVVIGTKTWTSTNLNVTTYRDGTPIPEVRDSAEWANLTTGAWCHLNNDPANDAIYGKMYNHYAVVDPRGLAPVGYHVPTFAEYDMMIQTIPPGAGCYNNPAWYNAPALMSPSFYGGTNTTGFSALKGGWRTGDASNFFPPGDPFNEPAGKFHTFGTSFWSSDAEGNYNYIYLAEQCAIGSTPGASDHGAYVRLIKD